MKTIGARHAATPDPAKRGVAIADASEERASTRPALNVRVEGALSVKAVHSPGSPVRAEGYHKSQGAVINTSALRP